MIKSDYIRAVIAGIALGLFGWAHAAQGGNSVGGGLFGPTRKIQVLTADPATCAPGTAWVNSTSQLFKVCAATNTVSSIVSSASPTLTGGVVVQNTGAAATIRFNQTTATFSGYIGSTTNFLQVAANRSLAGTYDDTGKASAALNIGVASGDGHFDFYTTATNNGALVQAFKITKNQGLYYPIAALTAGTATATNTAEIRTVTHRYDITNAMVVALGASTTGDVNIFTLPAKTRVVNAYVVIDSPDTSANALTVAVGRVAAGYIDYIVASDAKAAANTVYGDASGERGTNLTGYDLPSITGTTLVRAHFIKTTTNLSTVTGLAVRIYITTEVLP